MSHLFIIHGVYLSSLAVRVTGEVLTYQTILFITKWTSPRIPDLPTPPPAPYLPPCHREPPQAPPAHCTCFPASHCFLITFTFVISDDLATFPVSVL